MKSTLIIICLLSYSLIPTYIFKIKWLLGFKSSNQEVMLTFDDGPDAKYTLRLLKLLEKNNIKASFFIISKFAEENPAIIKLIQDSGHTIGIHSHSHTSNLVSGIFKTKESFTNSLRVMEKLNVDVKYYRPPWGQVNLAMLYYLRKYNLKLVLWNVMVGDWKKKSSPLDIETKLCNKIEDGSIICLHDGRGANEAPKRTIEALNNLLPSLKNKYNFITVGEYYEK